MMNRFGRVIRKRPKRIKPTFLYFAVAEGYLTEEEHSNFIDAWKESGNEVLGIGGVEDVDIKDVLNYNRKDMYFGMSVSNKLVKKVIHAAEFLDNRMNPYR